MARIDWRIYERFVAGLMSEHASDDITVIPNAKIIGSISGVERQIDVLIDAKWDDDISRRIIVDAKLYKAAVDVKDVEMFEGMMKDCRAQHGVIVCPNGYTPAAKRRAQEAITIKLVPLSELDDLDLDTWEPCLGSCSDPKRKGSQHGLVLYDSTYGYAIGDLPVSIAAVGKCDVCNEFHVWCWDCGRKFALRDEDEYECYCDGRFWLTAIEDEIESTTGEPPGRSVNLLLILQPGVVLSVDRRKMR